MKHCTNKIKYFPRVIDEQIDVIIVNTPLRKSITFLQLCLGLVCEKAEYKSLD